MREDAFGPASDLVGGLVRWAHEANMRLADSINSRASAGTDRPRQRLAYRRRKGQRLMRLDGAAEIERLAALKILRRWDLYGLPPVRSFD